MIQRICAIALLIAAGSLPAYGANLAAFTACIGSDGHGAVCQLDPGTYSIASTLSIARSNITIKGTIVTSPRDTVIQRAPGFQGSLLRDPSSQAGTPVLNAITLRDLTIDGNRNLNTSAYTSYQPDVSFFSTKSLLVTNCDFINSPNTGLALYGSGTGGVVVNNSYFGNPVIYGMWSDAPGSHASLGGPNGYLQCGGLQFVDSVVVANSQFENSGEPAILGNITNLQIANNVFTNNHSDSIPFGDTGGQIDLVTCTNNAAVVGNTFKNGSTGPNGLPADGIELHGTSLTIVDNLVTNNTGCGITTAGIQNVFVADWNPASGLLNNLLSGICLDHPANFRPDDSIILDSVNSISNGNWGIWIHTADLPITHVTITNSCLKGNANAPTSLAGLGSGAVIQNNSTSACGPI